MIVYIINLFIIDWLISNKPKDNIKFINTAIIIYDVHLIISHSKAVCVSKVVSTIAKLSNGLIGELISKLNFESLILPKTTN